MAVFGLTSCHEDDASRRPRRRRDAGDAGRLNEDFEQRYGVVLATRTGINTGTVAGRGIEPDRNFVAGDTANTAARLQQTAEPGEIVLAEPTYRLVREFVEAERLPVELKGKQASVAAYRLIGFESMVIVLGWRLPWSAARTSCAARVGARPRRSERTAGSCPSSARRIGKSRLVHEFAAGLDERATVLAGAAFRMATGSRSGLSPRWSSRRRDQRERWARGGCREAGGVAGAGGRCANRRRGDRPAHRADGDERRRGEGFWSVRRLFASLAEVRPVACSGRRPVGRGNASLAGSRTWYAIRRPFRSSYSAPVAQTSSSGARTGEAAAEAEARR